MHLLWGPLIAGNFLLGCLAMGLRGGLVVFRIRSITFALTLLSYYMLDYTMNEYNPFFALVSLQECVDVPYLFAEISPAF